MSVNIEMSTPLFDTASGVAGNMVMEVREVLFNPALTASAEPIKVISNLPWAPASTIPFNPATATGMPLTNTSVQSAIEYLAGTGLGDYYSKVASDARYIPKPTEYVGKDGQVATIDEATSSIVFKNIPSAASAFTDLTDTPVTLIGQASKVLQINEDATAVAFVDSNTIGRTNAKDLDDIPDYTLGSTIGKVLSVNSTKSGFDLVDYITQTTKIDLSQDSSIVLSNATTWLADSSARPISRPLPALPTDGYEVTIRDDAGRSTSNKITVVRNGNTIMGLAEDMDITVSWSWVRLKWSTAANTWKVTAGGVGAQVKFTVMDEFKALYPIGHVVETLNSANPFSYYNFGTWGSLGTYTITLGPIDNSITKTVYRWERLM